MIEKFEKNRQNSTEWILKENFNFDPFSRGRAENNEKKNYERKN